MTLSPLQLAAIVSAGVPGIYPVGAEPIREDSDDFDSAIIADSTGRRWRVRAPYKFLLNVRLDEGSLPEEEAKARLLQWWEQRREA